MNESLTLLEKYWHKKYSENKQKSMEEISMVMLEKYLGGLRGEEVILLSFMVILLHWGDT